MPRPPRPFHNAFLALLLAIGIPATVVLFATVRARQLQSKANPRWARFAGKVESNTSRKPTSDSSAEVPDRAASAITLKPTSSISETVPGASFTGSVTGHRSFDVPVQTQPLDRHLSESVRAQSETEFVETPPIIFRPVEEETVESPSAMLIGRLESQLNEVRQRLESLSSQQQELREDEIRREQELLSGLKNLNEISQQVRSGLEARPVSVPRTESTSPVPPKPPGFDAEKPSSETEGPYDPDISLPPQMPESKTPSPLPTDLPEPEESAIRIRRSTGENLTETYSIDIQDADIRQVFSQLSEAAEISIVPSPEIQGRVSLNVHDVHFDAALNALIRSRDYIVEREDGIMIVRTADEVSRRKHQNRQMQTKLYCPNYIGAAELIRLIEPVLSADGRHSVTSSKSTGTGEDSGDGSGSSREIVVVQDISEVLQQIDQIMVDVDVPPLQVRIEAKILRVRLSEGLKQGLDLGQLPCHQDADTSNAEGGLKHASLSCNVPTFIKSIERLADTSLVTSQRIQVLNKHRAEMLFGDRIGYQSHAGDEVHFLESGTRLILRPSISTDGFIRLEIQPEHSTATAATRKGAPRQNTSELKTHVMIRDGATVAIAGLIAEQAVETTRRVPLVSSIPIVGAPFRQKKESLQRTELIMLVTPRIVIDSETEAEGQCLEQALEERAMEFRDQQSHKARHNLARAHYDRATCHFQQGNYVKARQQIDASLRQDKTDLQALKLRNEINQSLMR